MKKKAALQLLHDYGAFLEDNYKVLSSHGVLFVAKGMYERFPQDGSKSKANRWLGFMQGVLYANNIFNLDELKEHSRREEIL